MQFFPTPSSTILPILVKVTSEILELSVNGHTNTEIDIAMTMPLSAKGKNKNTDLNWSSACEKINFSFS